MKKLLILLAVCALIAMPVKAQTQTNYISFDGPAMDALRFLGTGSNWMIAPYGIYGPSSHAYGAGVCALYKVSDFIAPGIRLDYFNGSVVMPSGQFQLQAPLTLMGKLTVVPFVFSGIATPLAGKGKDNGSPIGMFGVGAAVRVSSHFDIVLDVEKWTNFQGNQYRLGFLYKF